MKNQDIFNQAKKAEREAKIRNELKVKLSTVGTKLLSESGESVEVIAVNGTILTCKGAAGIGEISLSDVVDAFDSGFFKFA